MTRTTPLRRMTLHFSQIFLTLGRTFMRVSLSLELLSDAAAGGVLLENGDEDFVAFDQPDDAVARFLVEPRFQSSPVV